MTTSKPKLSLRPGPDAPRLKANHVHLWISWLNTGSKPPARAESLLDAKERHRAERFRFEKDRNRFVMARAGLRRLLSNYLGEPAEKLRFGANARGKPFLEWPDEAALSFNLSHSAELALYGVSTGCDIGVDVERIRPVKATAIAERFFSPAESAGLSRLTGPGSLTHFFRLWTAKEAYLKALGEGFARSLRSFTVHLEPGEAPRLQFEREPSAGPQARSRRRAGRGGGAPRPLKKPERHWNLRCFVPADGFVAAAVVALPDPITFEWSFEL